MKGLWGVCLVVVLASVVNAGLTPAVQALVNDMVSKYNLSADPCADFYEYACGTYLHNNPIPANITEPTYFNPIHQALLSNGDVILQNIMSSTDPLINAAYESCMLSSAELQADFEQFYVEQVNRIDSVNVQQQEQLFQLISESAIRTPAFLAFRVNQDYNTHAITLDIKPAGNTYEFLDDYSNQTSLDILANKMAQAFSLFEFYDDALSDAYNVIDVEVFCLKSSYSSIQNISVAALSNATGINFVELLSSADMVVTPQTYIWVTNVDYIKNLAQVSSMFAQNAVYRFFEWKLYQFLSTFNITSCWDNPVIGLRSICSNFINPYYFPYKPPFDQSTVCRYYVVTILSGPVGLAFSNAIANETDIANIQDAALLVQEEFNSNLPKLGWMDPTSAENAQFKLSNLVKTFGHPNWVDDDTNVIANASSFYQSNYHIVAAKNAFANLVNSSPFNRSDFYFYPTVLSAEYDKHSNSMNFAAIFLQNPEFDPAWPKFFQYARLGWTLGHEITHGYDSQGSKYNAFGYPGLIYDQTTQTQFKEELKCVEDYYSSYVAFGNTTLDGENTVDEDAADMGGAKNAFFAYQNWVAQNGLEFSDGELIKGLTVNQTFFLFMAQTYCSSENHAYLVMELEQGNHSPDKFRVLGPLSQLPEFAAAFYCPAGSPMNPTSRCNLW